MNISNLTGGLGNQMFQYAIGRSLAIQNNTELKLHFTNALFCTQRSYKLDCFNIKAKITTKEDLKKFGIVTNRVINRLLYLFDQRLAIKFNNRIVTERSKLYDSRILTLPNNVYLQGYWQNEKYFNHIANIIRKDFTYKKPFSKKNIELAKKIATTHSCSIHVRRGDYLKYNSSQLLGLDYYRNAINTLTKKISSPIFFMFSDDIEWCKNNFKINNETIYVEKNLAYEDMRLMSLCKHNIIANSSFSWWGAWLNNNNNKILLSPENI